MDLALISRLADQGVLGILSAISISLNFFLIKMLLTEKDKRREDAVETRDNLVAPIKEMKETLNNVVGIWSGGKK